MTDDNMTSKRKRPLRLKEQLAPYSERAEDVFDFNKNFHDYDLSRDEAEGCTTSRACVTSRRNIVQPRFIFYEDNLRVPPVVTSTATHQLEVNVQERIRPSCNRSIFANAQRKIIAVIYSLFRLTLLRHRFLSRSPCRQSHWPDTPIRHTSVNLISSSRFSCRLFFKTALFCLLSSATVVKCLIPQNAAVNLVPAQHVVVGPSPAASYGQPPVYGTSSPSSGGYGNTNNNDDPNQVWVAGFDNNFQPWSYTDKSTASSGTLRGFFVDVWFHVCRIARKKCRAVAIDIQDCFNYTTYMAGRGLQMNFVDTCGGVAPFETAEQSADFGIPIAAYPETGIVVPKGNPRRIEPSELSGKRIGVTTDSFYVDLRDCLTRNGVTDFIPVFGNFSQLGAMVLSGGIDGRIGFPAAPLGFIDQVDYAGNITPFQCTEEVATFAWNVRNFKFARWFVPALDIYLNSKEFELMCFHADQLYGWPVNCLPRYRVQQYSVQPPPPTYYHKHLQNPYETLENLYNLPPVQSNYPSQPYQQTNVLQSGGGYGSPVGLLTQPYQQYPPQQQYPPPPANFYAPRGHTLYGRSANPNAQLAFNYLLTRPVLSPKALDPMASLTPRINFESAKTITSNSIEGAASGGGGKIQHDMPHAELRLGVQGTDISSNPNISERRTPLNNFGVSTKLRIKERSAALSSMPLVLATSSSDSNGEVKQLVKDGM